MWARRRSGENLENITELVFHEAVGLDPDRLEELYQQLGNQKAEEVLCRALEELAVRLSNAHRAFRKTQMEDMHIHVKSLLTISEQVGMYKMAQVARDVLHCHEQGDQTSLVATFARLMRVGEGSLSQIWDLQNVTL